LKLKSKELRWIELKDNPLNEDAYKVVIPQLRKNIRGIRVFTPFRMIQLLVPSILFAILIIAGVLFVIRNWKQKGRVFEIISGLLSAGVGWLFGGLAQVLYSSDGDFTFYGNGYENPLWVGGIAGGVLGLLAGVWFAQFLRGLFARGRSGWAILGKGILAGIGLGLICSTAVHAVLMIAYRNMDLRPMLIGAGFGFGTGLLAGLVLAGCFVVGYKNGFIKGKEKI
jgi:hypothetical protein